MLLCKMYDKYPLMTICWNNLKIKIFDTNFKKKNEILSYHDK